MKNPQLGEVIPGTNGLRKFRIRANGHGKRGGARVAYVDIVIAKKIYFIYAYSKNEKADLTADEKKQIRKMIDILNREAQKGGC